MTTLGRLETPEQFGEIIVRADGNRVIYLKDVARVELGAKAYDTLGRIDGVPSALMVVYQSPGGNSVQVAAALRTLLDELGRGLPDGLEFRTVYDTSAFVVSAIDEVYKTIFEATGLVILVVFIFLGSVRSTLIPIAAIPVSLIGTFFAMKLFGFSLNLPTLFGLILAIGIVVDDAIVVVENVERNLSEHHLPPKEATSRAMIEVFGPVVGISLVLMAVFLPTAALPGISGQLYRQVCADDRGEHVLQRGVRPHAEPRALGGHPAGSTSRGRSTTSSSGTSTGGSTSSPGGMRGWCGSLSAPPSSGSRCWPFAATCALIVWTVQRVPTGFVPDEDKGLIVTEIRMPDAASQERTLGVIKEVERILLATDGVNHVGAFQGFSLIAGNGSNYGVAFAGAEAVDRTGCPRGGTCRRSSGSCGGKFAGDPGGVRHRVLSPGRRGAWGNAAGFDLRLEDRGGVGRVQMEQFVQELSADGNAQTKLRGVASAYRAAVPQLFADIDREKAKKLSMSLQDVFSTLSVNLGSAYVNDFNKFGAHLAGGRAGGQPVPLPRRPGAAPAGAHRQGATWSRWDRSWTSRSRWGRIA